MNGRTDRLMLGGGVFAALAVLALSWLFLISPKLADASSLDDQTDAATSQNDVLRARLVQLQHESSQLPQLQQQLQAAEAALPADSGMPDFIRQVNAQASAAGLTVGSITAAAPTTMTGTGGSAAPTAAAPATGATGSGSGAKGSTAGLYAIPVTISTTGPADRQQAFLRALQHVGPRTAVVSSAQLSPAGTAASGSIDGSSTLSVQLQVFVAPGSAKS
ncbi:type 4a pilus biogenesis protein PilO [Oryzihumus sp.]|uniref:type 4a pilus biogenesis protein PilO n=1 Tax=Oryzihumus sp. TaxID=1968903 RepID=UPI002ED9F270